LYHIFAVVVAAAAAAAESPESEVEEEDQPSEEAEACRHGHYSLCLFSGSLLRINEQFDCKPLAST